MGKKKKKETYAEMLQRQAEEWPVDDRTGVKRYRHDEKTIKLTDKILRNEIRYHMERGLLLDEVAAQLDLSTAMLEVRLASNRKNKEAFQIALTKLDAYYQKELRRYITRNHSKEALALFYSHFLKVMERKRPVEVSVENTGMSHEEALKELS